MSRIIALSLSIMGLGIGVVSVAQLVHWKLNHPAPVVCEESVGERSMSSSSYSCSQKARALVVPHYGSTDQKSDKHGVYLVICQCPPFSDPFKPYIEERLDAGLNSSGSDSSAD